MKDRLKQRLEAALLKCFAEGSLSSGVVPEIDFEVPARPEHGDFAANLALGMARAEKKAPRQVAETLVKALGDGDGLWSKVEIAGPGFINFFLNPECWYGVLDRIARDPESFCRSNIGAGRRVQVEFVSANPTGPLHIGHGRGAVTGDVTATLYEAVGFEVQREYYINDAGNQMNNLGRSFYLRYLECLGEAVEFPAECYQGEYIRDIVRPLAEKEGRRYLELPEADAVRFFSKWGGDAILDGIREDLELFGVRHDIWFSEQGLYDRGEVEAGIAFLKERGHLYEEGGALWFNTTRFGDDKDRVLVRSNGATTYFASDIAYHKDKFDRGFDRVVDVWGADHHGYVPRMKAAFQGLGRSPEDLQVILVQLVNLLRGGVQVAMSTRSGEFVTLREVLDEVGRDACRFFFLMRRTDSQLDFDLELAKQQSSDNPVYYVQYAHARVCSINRNAAEAGLALPEPGQVDFSALAAEEELALAKLLSRYPETLEGAALQCEPHRLVFYLQDLASRFHTYYNRHKVLVEDVKVGAARLYLVNCVRTVLADALGLLGVSAPEKM